MMKEEPRGVQSPPLATLGREQGSGPRVQTLQETQPGQVLSAWAQGSANQAKERTQKLGPRG